MFSILFKIRKYFKAIEYYTKYIECKKSKNVGDKVFEWLGYSYLEIGERDEQNPLPWDKIAPAEYTIWDSYFDYDATIEKSKERMQNSEQLKLIDENAKWIKTIRDRNESDAIAVMGVGILFGCLSELCSDRRPICCIPR